jgi:hypothetical protein
VKFEAIALNGVSQWWDQSFLHSRLTIVAY